MNERNDKLKILDLLYKYGCTTTLYIQEHCKMVNASARISQLREDLVIHDFFVKNPRTKKRFKVYYVFKRQAMAYVERNNLVLV